MNVSKLVSEFSDRSDELISSLGLVKPNNERPSMVFPEDLSSIHSEELSVHLSYWGELCSYVYNKISILEGTVVLAKQKLEEETDIRVLSKLKEGKTSSYAKAWVGSCKTVINLKRDIAQIESDLKVLKGVAFGYDLKNSAISREITRRQQEKALRNE